MKKTNKHKCKFITPSLDRCRKEVKTLRALIGRLEDIEFLGCPIYSKVLTQSRKVLTKKEKELNEIETKIMVENRHKRLRDWKGWEN